jgi:hypothetical protein
MDYGGWNEDRKMRFDPRFYYLFYLFVDYVFWVSDYFGSFYDEAEMGLDALMMNDLLSAAVCLLSGMMWELLAIGMHIDHKSGENSCRGLLALGCSGGHCWWE